MKLGDIIDPLLAFLHDAEGAQKLLDHESSQFARRAYIRSSFAYIEGATWLLKQTCLNAHSSSGRRRLSVAEYALLRDEGYELKANGDPVTQTKFLRLLQNMKFTNRVFNRLFRASVNLGVGGKDWNNLVGAVKVRNRITHPRSMADYDVSDEEIALCRDTTHWFNDIIYSYIKAIHTRSQEVSAKQVVPADRPKGRLLPSR